MSYPIRASLAALGSQLFLNYLYFTSNSSNYVNMVPKFILIVYDIEDPHVIFFFAAIDQLGHGKWSCQRSATPTPLEERGAPFLGAARAGGRGRRARRWRGGVMDDEDATLARKQKFQPHKKGSTASYRSRDYH